MQHKRFKFAFIGAGNIANAIINGFLDKAHVPAEDLYVYDIDKSKYNSYIMRGVNCTDTMKEAVSSAEYVLFALKPAHIKSAVKQISAEVTDFDKKVYISVAAAVSTDYICKAFKSEIAVIRTMPNTPLLVGEGAVAICKNDAVKPKDFELICRLFSSISTLSVLSEEFLNPIISVNGSSPAYVYLFYQAMLDGAIAQGIDEEKAKPLILKSISGALKMLETTGKTAKELIKDVSSPGGTTIAALDVLYKNGFESTVSEAMRACTERADEMSKELPD